MDGGCNHISKTLCRISEVRLALWVVVKMSTTYLIWNLGNCGKVFEVCSLCPFFLIAFFLSQPFFYLDVVAHRLEILELLKGFILQVLEKNT